jgi:2-phospho-L-lactate/phosphoenolpyruvate guanylyltransferase
MRVSAVIPVKPMDRALGRLSAVLGRRERRELQVAMLTDLLIACGDCARLSETIIVTSDDHAAQMSRALGARVLPDHAPPRGMNPAVGIGQADAVARGQDAVLILTSDLPLVGAEDLTRVIDACGATPGGVLVPSRAGTGTNALVVAPPDALTTELGVDSRARHLEGFRRAGLAVTQIEIASLGLDVDTPDDLFALASWGHGGRAAAVCTEWNLTERLGAGVLP